MKENKSLVVPKINKGTVVGELVEADYDGFVALMETTENVGDLFIKVDNTVAQQIEAGKDIKRVVDVELKKFKKYSENIRTYLTRYMGDKKIERLEGDTLKSIIYHAESKTTSTKAIKQIMVGRKYKNLDEISKDELVKMLEAKGVKVRTITEDVKVTTDAGIRVTR